MRTIRLPFPALLAAVLTAAAAARPGVTLRGDPDLQATLGGGAELAASLGCGACHQGLPTPTRARDDAPGFGPGADPLPGEFVFRYLADPQPRRDIAPARMPDFRLDEAERVALALYLGQGPRTGALSEAAARHPDVDAELGAFIFRTLGCGGCHADRDGAADAARADRGPDLSGEGDRVRGDWLRRYLSAPSPIRGPAHPLRPGARMPDFRLTDAEVEALAAYLGGSSAGPRPSRDDPASARRREGQDRGATRPLTPLRKERARRLLQTRLPCLGCHTLNGEGGIIGPPLDGVGARLRPEALRRLIANPGEEAPGSGMPGHPLAAREADLIAAYLLEAGEDWKGSDDMSLADPGHPARILQATDGGSTDAPGATPTPPPGATAGADPTEAAEAARLYRRHCAACHGVEGRGDGFNAPHLPSPPTNHADPELMGRRPDDTLYDGIHAGGWVLDGTGRMPAFGTLLSDSQIRSLVGHIQTLCRCAQPDWAGDR